MIFLYRDDWWWWLFFDIFWNYSHQRSHYITLLFCSISYIRIYRYELYPLSFVITAPWSLYRLSARDKKKVITSEITIIISASNFGSVEVTVLSQEMCIRGHFFFQTLIIARAHSWGSIFFKRLIERHRTSWSHLQPWSICACLLSHVTYRWISALKNATMTQE